ncbi:MAG: phosphonate ABC transporter ATP-binding protein [Alphaproteobacteria bacterium]
MATDRLAPVEQHEPMGAPVHRLVPGSPLLSIRSLRKSFDGRTPVLADVSLDLANHETVALIGSNGTGKSTLLRCCVRLIEPDGGDTQLFGENLRALNGRALRRLRAQAGFVFQKHNLVPRLSVLSNVVHGAQGRVAGPMSWHQLFAPQALRQEAMHCLDLVGLADLAARRADQLSGGQSQRVAIARALMQRPRLVLADEPVASLDPKAGEEVMCLFADLMRRQGVSVLFTSHNVGQAIRYSDRVIGLRGGRIALEGLSGRQSESALSALYE